MHLTYNFGVIVRFQDLKQDLHVNKVEAVFLDCPDGFAKPRGYTLSNTVKILTKVSTEPFMRVCDMRHVEKVHDKGDVQENLEYLRKQPEYGNEFVESLTGLKIDGM